MLSHIALHYDRKVTGEFDVIATSDRVSVANHQYQLGGDTNLYISRGGKMVRQVDTPDTILRVRTCLLPTRVPNILSLPPPCAHVESKWCREKYYGAGLRGREGEVPFDGHKYIIYIMHPSMIFLCLGLWLIRLLLCDV